MAIPLAMLVLDGRTSQTQGARRFREIENHYHLETIAQNTSDLVDFQTYSLRGQAKMAAAGLLAARDTSKQFAAMNDRFGDVVRHLEGLQDGVEALNETAAATLDAVEAQTDVLREGFERIADQMLAQGKLLVEIADTLRRPYKTQMRELRDEAYRWLKNGMNQSTEQDRNDDFADAFRLYQEVIKNPIGNQDYSTWFQIGWLLWKYKGEPDEAEKAFHRATRLGAESANEYHILSLRHCAYMKDLQGKHEDAYQTIQGAIVHSTEYNAPFDAARYAAKTGRTDEALRLLETCIECQPTTIISMFAEEDFQK